MNLQFPPNLKYVHLHYDINLGPDHLILTLQNWHTRSVLALNKKLKVNWKFQFFI